MIEPDFRKASRAQLYVILYDDPMATALDKHAVAVEIHRRRKLPNGRVEYKKAVRLPR